MVIKGDGEEILEHCKVFFMNGLSFNVARSKSFKVMVDAIGYYGKHLKPQSYHELRVSLLKKELEITKEMMKPLELERVNMVVPLCWMDGKIGKIGH
jgi:hypothetical protein